ncbi:MAG: cell cycle transcriptional regulator TrcR [Alphaproteobacteria bacterium]
MSGPLMPQATAVWLIDNTTLTFEQVGAFCDLHPLEVQALADGDIGQGIKGRDPIAVGELSRDNIKACEEDSNKQLKLSKLPVPRAAERTKGPRYTPVAKRQDKPDGIAWVVRNQTELSDAQIVKLIGTTKNTIGAVRDRSHWNSANIHARHPVDLGLCTYMELSTAVEKARSKLTSEEREVFEAKDRARLEVNDAPVEENKKAPSIEDLFRH